MELRRAGPDDAEAVCDVYVRSRASAGAAIPPEVHTRDQVAAFVTHVIVATRETWLAWDGDRPAGVVVLDGDELDWLYVAPEQQGRGVGSALVRHAMACRPDGLALWTFVSNAPARGFYEAHGFRAVRETDGARNEEGAPDVRYVWGGHSEGG